MRKLLAAIFCLVIPVLGCTDPISENSNPLPVRVGGVQMLTMTTPRALHAAVILHDGRVLICGGTSNANVGGVLNSAEIYDPVAGTFTPTGSMTTVRQGHTATVLSHGEVLIAGGTSNVGYRSQLASAEIYDPVSGTFRAVGSMTTKSARSPVSSIALQIAMNSQGWPMHSLKPTGLPPESSRKLAMKRAISRGAAKAE